MKTFESRLDRFNFFESFESPLLNITFRLEVPDFVSYCKATNLPPFHFFLFQLFESLMSIDNFRYRIYQGKVIKIDQLIPSYTVLNKDNLFNYTRFEYTSDLKEFIQRSLEAKEESYASSALIHNGVGLDERTLKDYVFITSIPWLDFTSIQHPVYKAKSADIPSISWGKFSKSENGINMPLSVQAHHGFVDGYHIALLADTLKEKIRAAIK